jgi:hypothetical protein
MSAAAYEDDTAHIRVDVLGVGDAGEILTLQRAAYITEAVAHHDFALYRAKTRT